MEGFLETADTLDARQFVLAVKRLADSLSFGTDRSPFLGAGVEYVQSRAYVPGDPIKTIDWRVTARTGRLFVKEYEAPKRLPGYLLVDTSASMTISSLAPGHSKYALAIHIAGGLALACLERVSPVGVLGVGERGLRIQPSLSKHQVLQWLHELRTFRYDERTTLGRRIAELGPSLKERALVIVLSDLHDPAGIPAIKQLAHRHDVVVIQLRDSAEVSLRGSGFLRAREAETGRAFVTHGRKRWIDPESAEETFKRAGIDHLRLETGQPCAVKIRQFFQARDILGKGSR